ncbi:hypothetical protein FOMPIDRAFT_102078 [Fomitopsis schrenkii]|uniref:Uncharacterized protein n=1 Tax=Fomitopsis schrenkii TaxID=2126942 RepID=S8ECP7_FOMSC|nr:hypothetical protein FOMPIDRAFT_102078 [Fomitopsis schrenkii]
MDALMDAAILVTLDPELASDMVKLLGEQLKRLRAKSCALEEELRIAREAQPGIQEETDVRGAIDALNVQIEGLRETVRLRDENISQKAETVAVLEKTVSQRDAVLRVCAAEAKKNQDMITKLSNANSQLEKNSARMRTRNEQVARNDKAVGALQAQLMEKEDKLRAFDDYKKMVELSLSSLSNERDQARAIKSKLEEKYKAQLELLKVVTQERDRYKADAEKYQTEAKKYQAEVKKHEEETTKCEAEVRRYEAQAKEARNTVNNLAWAVQFGQFIAMMQALPEPAETLPCRSKIRSYLSAECVGHTPRVFEIIHQV